MTLTDRLPVQMRHEGPQHWREKLGGTIPRVLGEAAWEGYAADGHGSQSCARLHERGGFGLAELGYYLARALDEGRATLELRSHEPPRNSGEADAVNGPMPLAGESDANEPV